MVRTQISATKVESANSSSTQKDIFAIMGHGYESIIPLHEREKVPPHTTVVVFTTCGKSNYITTVCEFLEIFKKEYNHYLEKPFKYKDELNHLLGDNQLFTVSIRIYLPGDRLPEMHTDLFLKFRGKGFTISKEKQIKLIKSGVYRINNIREIDRKVLAEPDYPFVPNRCYKWSGSMSDQNKYSKDIHNEIFKGNIFERDTKTTKFSELSSRTFRVFDIINAIGPGVYYYIGCRNACIDSTNEVCYGQVCKESEDKQGPKLPPRIDIRKLPTYWNRLNQTDDVVRYMDTTKLRLAIEKKINNLTEDITNNGALLKHYIYILSTKHAKKTIKSTSTSTSVSTKLYILPELFEHSFKIIKRMTGACFHMLKRVISCLYDLHELANKYNNDITTIIDRNRQSHLISNIRISINKLDNLNSSMYHNEQAPLPPSRHIIGSRIKPIPQTERSSIRTAQPVTKKGDTTYRTPYRPTRTRTLMKRLLPEKESFDNARLKTFIGDLDYLENGEETISYYNRDIISSLKFLDKEKKSVIITNKINILLQEMFQLALSYIFLYILHLNTIKHFYDEAYNKYKDPSIEPNHSLMYKSAIESIIDVKLLMEGIYESKNLNKLMKKLKTIIERIIQKNNKAVEITTNTMK